MDIYDELDRIRGQGFTINIFWGRSINFFRQKIGLVNSEEDYDRLTIMIEENEQWMHCMYRAILEFDEGFV